MTSTTSRMAGESIREYASRIEAKILACVRDAGPYGRTCYEIEQLCGLIHQTASARCSGLKDRKLLRVDGERRRPTQTGRLAEVLVLG
jgi:hypothetical protein